MADVVEHVIDRSAHGAETPPSLRYPNDGWLRGYFMEKECDVRGGRQQATAIRKNIDFLRLRDVALDVLDPRPGKRILDVGCADGATMVYCGLQGATVYGQELNPQLVAAANAYLKRFGIQGEVKCGDAAALAFPDNYFDAAISSDFFEHVRDDEKRVILRDIRRVLKPGAPLVIKTPNLAYLRLSLLYKRLGAICRLRNPLRLVIPHSPGSDDPQHIGLTTRWRLSRCLYDAGFLNYTYIYSPLRRFGPSGSMEVLSTEIPVLRDFLCEELFCRAVKPIALSHFPD